MTAQPNNFQFVTLVSKGGVPITLADAFGRPYPTTGSGALVFNEAPLIEDADLVSPHIEDPTWGVINHYPSPLTSLGDLWYHNGTNDTRLAMGAPGQVLRSDVSGLVWTSIGAGTITQITAGTGLTATPGNPITLSGTLSADLTYFNNNYLNKTTGGTVTGDITTSFTTPITANLRGYHVTVNSTAIMDVGPWSNGNGAVAEIDMFSFSAPGDGVYGGGIYSKLQHGTFGAPTTVVSGDIAWWTTAAGLDSLGNTNNLGEFLFKVGAVPGGANGVMPGDVYITIYNGPAAVGTWSPWYARYDGVTFLGRLAQVAISATGDLSSLGSNYLGSNAAVSQHFRSGNDTELMVYSDTLNEMVTEAFKASAPGTKYTWYAQKYGGQFKVGVGGILTTGNLQGVDVTATNDFIMSGALRTAARTRFSFPGDGTAILTNNAGTDFTGLYLGGTTSSFPFITRSGSGVAFKKADLSGKAVLDFQGVFLNNNSFFADIADGKFWFSNNAGTQGISVNVTASTAKFRNVADSADVGVTFLTPGANDNSINGATTAYAYGHVAGGQTSVNDAGVTLDANSRLVVYTAISAARNVTLPAASGVPAGRMIDIIDQSGSVSGTNTISLVPNGSDTIAGSNTTQVIINIPRGRCRIHCDGSSRWFVSIWSVEYIVTAGSDTNMNNTANYFDSGATAGQGTVGTWEAEGTITMLDTAGGALLSGKLYDGTTAMASGAINSNGANGPVSITLTGRITTPGGNIRMAGRDHTATTGVIKFNASTNSKDTQIKVWRVA